MIKNLIILLLLITPIFSGAQKINKTDKNGLKQGVWIKKYPNGKIKYKGSFVDNKPSGRMERFHTNGNLKAVLVFSENGTKAKAELYNESTQLVAKGNFIKSQKDSIWNYFDKRGSVRASETYQNGIKNGLSEYHFKNGKVSESIPFVNGKKHGIWKRFFEDGKPYIEAKYQEGKLNGGFQAFYPNGIIEFGGDYLNNKKTGNWDHYSEKGDLLFTIEYKNGVAMNQDELDQQQIKKLEQMEAQKEKLINSDPENYVNDPDSFLRSQMRR
ncbi:hypothetical protein DF185_14460 [Marinifilum breve]|uniref:Toxin-antitoxin system YwqK family antitoxin n=1 Tax=Marinifilum breve TaxID=2184082 RepID=A0A2V3ZW19_9BACT|nr:toxin-antitoxin system YwqK family antitoxin [Marinifilum breve]PXX99079.1 hypothetical protein DF185_14460 [Marinifilum breve]